MAFTCQVCFESCTKRLALPALATLNGDKLRTADCGHPICQACMAAYVSARVEEQRAFGIRCPAENCNVELYEQDVQKLVECGALDKQVAARLGELRARDYKARLEELHSELPSLPTLSTLGLVGLPQQTIAPLQVMWKSTRLCPRCSVVIEKSSGCDSFGCICGHRFNFAIAPRVFGDGVKVFDHLGVAHQYGAGLAAFCEHSKQHASVCKVVADFEKVTALALRAGKRVRETDSHYALWLAALGQTQKMDLVVSTLCQGILPEVFKKHFTAQGRVCPELRKVPVIRLLAQRVGVPFGKAYLHHAEWERTRQNSTDLMAMALWHRLEPARLQKRCKAQRALCQELQTVESIRLLAQRVAVRFGTAYPHHKLWQEMPQVLVRSADLMAVALRHGLEPARFRQSWEQRLKLCKECQDLAPALLLAERCGTRFGDAIRHRRAYQAQAHSCTKPDLMAAMLWWGVRPADFNLRQVQQRLVCKTMASLPQVMSTAKRQGVSIAHAELALFARRGDAAARAALKAFRDARKTRKTVETLVSKLGLGRAEAQSVVERASAKDEAAQEVLRRARQPAPCTSP